MARVLLLGSIFVFAAGLEAQVIPGGSGGGGPTATIIGQIQTATAGAVNNGTLTFTLSQPAVAVGTATLVTQAQACYTSTQGNIVGLPDPLVPPVTSTNVITGTLPAGTYYFKYYYFNANGSVSGVSPETSVILSSQGTVAVNPPLLQPSSALGYGIAVGTTPGGETIQGTITGWSQYQQQIPLITGALPQPINNSSCNLYFSDQLEPSGTFYTVNLVNRNGAQISGFPQTWCTYGGAGGTINVSQGAPTGNCGVNGVFYPTPLLANPANGTAQSTSTGLNIGGNLTVSGILSAAQIGSFVNGLQVQTIGGGTNQQTLDIFDSSTTDSTPHKYLFTSGGTLNFFNSAYTTQLASLTDTGVFSALSFGPITSAPGVAMSISSGSPSIGAGPATTISGGNGTGSGSNGGGNLVLNGGGSTGAAPRGTLQSNTFFSTYNNTTTAGKGVPFEVAAVALTGQTAAIGTTTLYTFPTGVLYAPTFYRLNWVAKVTTPAGSSSTLGALTITYTDGDGVSQTITAGALTSAGAVATTTTTNTTAAILQGIPLTIYPQAGTTISYAVAYASNSANTMTYEINIRLEAM